MGAKVKGLTLTNNSDIKNFVPERLIADPATPIEGRVWFNTSVKKLKTTNDRGEIIELGSVEYDGMKIDLDIYLSRQSISSIVYDSSNRPTTINYANGYTVEATYVVSGNGAGEIESMTYKKGEDVLYTVEYTYDSSSRIASTTVTEA
jgi:hypothetical protein